MFRLRSTQVTPPKKQFCSQTGFNGFDFAQHKCLSLPINKSCVSTSLNTSFLQIGAISVLVLILAQKAASEALLNLGEASEELFRGDRLPILNVSTSLNTSFPDDDL